MSEHLPFDDTSREGWEGSVQYGTEHVWRRGGQQYVTQLVTYAPTQKMALTCATVCLMDIMKKMGLR